MFGLLKKAMIRKGAVSEKGVQGSSSALCGPGRKGWEKSPPLPLPALEPRLQFSEDGLVLRPAVVFYSISQSFFRIISHRSLAGFLFIFKGIQSDRSAPFQKAPSLPQAQSGRLIMLTDLLRCKNSIIS